MFGGGEYSPSQLEEEAGFSPMNTVMMTRKKKNKINNKRRFSDEQIKSLENMFESETRLEPRKKLQLAKELGLQPRQVAIWFQNKRARWKSKQLEREYSVLRANYNSLASRFDMLKKEKQALAIQLQELNNLMQNPGGDKEVGVNSTSTEGESENGRKCESEEKPSLSCDERSAQKCGLRGVSDEDSSIKDEYFGLEEEANLMNMADGSLTSQQQDWGSLNSDDALFDQSNGGCQWWDFWSTTYPN